VSTPPLEKIRADFDRIARFLAVRPEEPEPYDHLLLSMVPASCRELLEVGCGSGRMARLLAGRAHHVIGIDASAQMIELARARATGVPSLDFVCDDFMTHSFAGQEFNCVFTITTLHHLEYGPALGRMKSLLAPGGTLIVHDVRAAAGASDWLGSGIRATARGEIAGWLARRMRTRGGLAQAWRDHGATDRYLDISGVHALCAEHLPGATIHNHPLWRYTIVWRKMLQHDS
jgi:SAM-dependent methyltransferase